MPDAAGQSDAPLPSSSASPPLVSDLRERIAHLSPAKRALLEQKLLLHSTPSNQIPVLPDRNRAPLSFAEQRMWLTEQMEPGHPFYNMPLAARFHGHLDLNALRASIQQLVARHEALRSTYDQNQGQPSRRIHAMFDVEPTFTDLSQHETDDVLLKELRCEARRPFDLVRGPLIRCSVFRQSATTHVILLCMHHIVSDGWSMSVMLQELAECYRAEVEGTQPNLPPLRIQYADFAAWEQERMAGPRLEKLLGYWQSQLQDIPAVLDLPFDRPRTAVQDFEGAHVPISVSAQVSRRVKEMTARYKTTPFVFFLSAFFSLLSRYTRQADICVGTATANRIPMELERLIGFFVNTLAMRADLEDDPAFETFLQRVRQSVIQSQAYQELPFDKLVESMTDRRDRSHLPLVQAAFVFQNAPLDIPAGPDLVIERLDFDNGTVKNDLTLILEPRGEIFSGQLSYRPTLFDDQTVWAMAECFSVLCEAAVADPTCRISRLPLLTATQRNLVVKKWNSTHRLFPPPHTLHEIVRQNTRTCPQQIALQHRHATYTYQQLDDWSDRIACGLRELTTAPKLAVITQLPRSPALAATMLGILKAGGTYVPLDPQEPWERCRYIAAQTEAALIVRTVSQVPPNEEPPHTSTVTVEQLERAGQELTWALPEVSAESLAYIVFTSGSTGTPKGVPIQHQAIVNFIRAQSVFMDVSCRDRMLHALSPAFDGGINELLMPLINCATCVIADPEDVLDSSKLPEFLRREQVSVGFFLPALLVHLDPQQLPNLTRVCSAGDTLSAELASQWVEGRRFFNGYGPTEVTVGVSLMELKAPVPRRPPIGRPMANMRMYVLDQHKQPVPIGAPGEIHIGGMGVARGYLNDKEASEKRFLRDPFNDPQDGLMHATGDLGRWNWRGEMEFLGRVDRQLKIRGYRVEPDGVADAIQQSDLVQQAEVVPWGGEDQAARLVAYIVPAAAIRQSTRRSQVDSWHSLFEQVLRVAPPTLDREFDILGWNSEYDGTPIPPEQMRAWVNEAVANVMRFEPKRILEIGVGTGLMLFRIAPHVELYWGTDFLQASLQHLEEALQATPDLKERSRFFHCEAANFAPLAGERFDTILLNSVVQYFPSVEYLLKVLDQAVAHLEPRGRIVLGDIRSLPHLEALATGVEMARATDEMSTRELHGRVIARIAREKELLVRPELFGQLTRRYPGLTGMSVQLKGGPHDNELTRYRYEVALEFGDHPRFPHAEEEPLEQRVQSLEDVKQVLQRNPDQSVRFVGLMNARVEYEACCWEHLGMHTLGTVAELREAARDEATLACDPQSATELAAQFGCTSRVSWSRHGNPTGFELWVTPPGQTMPSIGMPPLPAETNGGAAHGDPRWQDYCNDPLADRLAAELAPQIREHLKQRIPAFMIPSAFVVLRSMPKTVRGKIDHASLPNPPLTRPGWAEAFVPPATRTEERMAEIWKRLLGVDPVGANDNFFELGGHSLLAVRLMAAIRETFDCELPLAALFHDATVRHLATLVDSPQLDPVDTTLVTLQPHGQATPLFCVHPAGGTVFCYRELAGAFTPRRPVYGLQAVGVDGRTSPHSDLINMAAQYVEAVLQTYPQGPYHLAGWSLGGIVAFEMARQLQCQGHRVGAVLLMDSVIPEMDEVQEDDFFDLLASLFPGANLLPQEQLRAMSGEEQLKYFVDLAGRAGLAPRDDLDAAQHVFQVFQSSLKAMQHYRPESFDGSVILLRPVIQRSAHAQARDPLLGWQQHVRGEICLEWVEGDHVQMVRPPHIDSLAAVIERHLVRTES